MRFKVFTNLRHTRDLLSWRKITLLALISLGCLDCGMALAGTLKGSATYRERIALPADAVFEVKLLDVSRADAPATVLGLTKLDPAGHPPFRFEIAYNDADVKSGHRYSVQATVKHQERLLFTTDRIYPLFDGRNAPLQILLVSAQGASYPEPRTQSIGILPASYEGEIPGASNPIMWHLDLLPEGRYQLRTIYVGQPEPNRFDDIGRWTIEMDSGRIVLKGGREAPIFLMPVEGGASLIKLDIHGNLIESIHNNRLTRLQTLSLIEPRLMLTGMFTCMADAASITLCVDGRSLPVATEGDYKALETAYMQVVPQPGQPLLVSLESLITQRPSMEEGYPPQTTVVVERFISVWPRESCGNQLVDSPLRGTYWKLVRLGDNPVTASANQREAHIVFATDELRIAGSGGCNRLIGSFEFDENWLRFGQMGGTMMSCPEGMDLEQQFLEALKKVERYRIIGNHLELLDATDAVIAHFEAVAQ